MEGIAIIPRSSANLTVDGATVSAPPGRYMTVASKSVAEGSASTPATTITANPSISVDSSTGVITASASATKSVTPTVSAGYVTSGTSGTVTVSGSNTSQLTTKAATTYNTSTSDQTIDAGTYLTGTQTIRAVTTSNISAGNIKEGVTIQVGDSASAGRIKSVTGTLKAGDTQLSGTYVRYATFTSSQLTNWSAGRSDNAATSIGSYALFGGGISTAMNASYQYVSTYYNNVETYNTSLTKGTASALAAGAAYLSASSNSTYALFSGGYNGSSYFTTATGYNSSLSKKTANTTGRRYSAAGHVGNYIVLGGGLNGSSALSTVEAYDTSLTRSTATALPSAVSSLGSGSVSSYVIFAGGQTSASGSGFDTVTAYNSSLTRSSATALDFYRNTYGASNDTHAIFEGSYNSNKAVDAYNNSLTKTRLTDMTWTISSMKGTSVNGVITMADGSNNATLYTGDLVRSTGPALGDSYQSSGAATAISKYAIYGGGGSAGGYSALAKVTALNSNPQLLLNVSSLSSSIKSSGSYTGSLTFS